MASGAQDHGPDAPEPRPEALDGEGSSEDLGRLQQLLNRGRGQLEAGRARAEEQLERNKDRPLVDVALRIWQRDRESAGSLVGSAIAFRLFLFFVPLLVFFVGMAGFLAQWVEADEVASTTSVTGVLADQIRTALSQPSTTRWLATGAGLVGMATAGRSLSKALVAASTLTWRLPVKLRASPRVVGAIIGVVIGMALCATVVNRIRASAGVGVASVSFIGVLLVYVVAWIALFMLLPRATPDPGALIPGALLVATTVATMQLVSQFYLPDRMGRASALYGAVSAAVVTLGWFFIAGRALVLGMAVNAVLYERFGSISTFVFSLPVIRILPQHSAWVRRFFGLDEPR